MLNDILAVILTILAFGLGAGLETLTYRLDRLIHHDEKGWY